MLPADLFDRCTPTQLVALLYKPAGAGNNRVDALAELTRLNRERGAKGLRPVVPSWLLG